MAKKKFVPYLATTSLRKVIDSMKSHPLNLEITVARGYVRAGNRERTEFHTEVGWKEYENTTYEAELDWHGSGLWLDRVETRLDQSEAHDMSLKMLRVRFEGDEDLVEALKGKWPKVGEVDLSENQEATVTGLPADSYFYLVLKNRKPGFPISQVNVKENVSWAKWWKKLNICDVCGKPLPAHNFNFRTLDVVGLESAYINDNVSRKHRPDFSSEFHYDGRTDVTSWIHQQITGPTKLASPNGMKQYTREEGKQWVVESV